MNKIVSREQHPCYTCNLPSRRKNWHTQHVPRKGVYVERVVIPHNGQQYSVIVWVEDEPKEYSDMYEISCKFNKQKGAYRWLLRLTGKEIR